MDDNQAQIIFEGLQSVAYAIQDLADNVGAVATAISQTVHLAGEVTVQQRTTFPESQMD